MIFHVGVLLGGDPDIFEGDVFGVGAGDAVGAGKIKVIKGDILDGAFFETFNHAAVPRIDGGDVVDMDVAELRGALGEGFHRGFGVAQGKQDGGADVPEVEIGGDDVFDDTAAAAGALDPDTIVSAIAVAIEKPDVADAARFFAANGADAVAMGECRRR